jgi:hypothetical protein
LSSDSAGLEVRVRPHDGPQPPTIQHSEGSEAPLKVMLEIVGPTPEGFDIALWQTGLLITPELGAVGTVELQSISMPDGALFGEEQGLFSLGDLPSADVAVTSVYTGELAGVSIPADVAIPIVELSLSVSDGANGIFRLSMSAHDSQLLDRTSYWSTGGENISEFPFENDISDGGVHHLADLQIGIGDADFNQDGFVDAADYTVWRDGLGTRFDEEAYSLWHSTFGVNLNNESAVLVPEPSATALVAIACLASQLMAFASPRRIRS